MSQEHPKQQPSVSGVVQREPELLRGYLEQLLADLPELAEPAAAVPSEDGVAAIADITPGLVDRELLAALTADEGEPLELAETDTDTADTHSWPEQRPLSLRPTWSLASFQALMFYIDEVPLAAPLLSLNGVIPWSEQIAAMPNSPPWYLGLLAHRGAKIRVLDSASLLLPRRNFDDPQSGFKHIVLIDNATWGLACHRLGEVLKLDPEQVKWRSSTARRPWLAGMVKQQLCGLLDVDGLLSSLQQTADGSA